MILIFVEDTYSHSGWCQDLVDGLVSELKMKRMAFRFIHSIEEMNQSSGYIYVIGSSTGLRCKSARGAARPCCG